MVQRVDSSPSEPKQRLNITDWAIEDRPREKMMIKGIRALSDAELIAILIGSGNKDETAVELSQRILNSVNNSLTKLGQMTVNDLKDKFMGIGEAKAISILAATELGRRRKAEEIAKPNVIKSSKDAYLHISPHISDLPQEEFWVIMLSSGCKVIDTVRVSQGATNATLVDVKLIMKPTLAKLAQSIIVCHNHPSGDTNPSSADKVLTKKIKDAANLLDIKLADHIIVGESDYFSFADNRVL